MEKKLTYRVKNWAEYNTALIQRGNISLWFSEDAIQKWIAPKQSRKGRPRFYSDDAILCALLLRSVYNLPLRALQGFLGALVSLLILSLPIPCYTQICRRAQFLGQRIRRLCKKRNVTDIVIDSTGLKVYGEGEWKVRQHGASKRRTWRKVHLAICPDSHEIVLSFLTENSKSDGEALIKMANHLPDTVERAYLDGAYDKEGCYRKLYEKNIDPILPPQRGAVRHPMPWMKSRNDSIQEILGLGGDDSGRKLWKKLKGYHRRSLAETGMYRFKTFFGGKLRARKMAYQKAEVFVKTLAMNKMTKLGMPKGKWEFN
jgi:Transposase DDE domain